MNVHEIITKYLQDNRYDGLCNDELDCGCIIDDLTPCGGEMDCEPGYKVLQDDGDWLIKKEKP